MVSKKHKFWLILVQLFLIIGSVVLLYTKFTGDEVELAFWAYAEKIGVWQWALLILLSVSFWVLDTSVWKTALKPFTQVSFFKALRYNVIAQSAGVLTPFLVGDYGLRSYFLKDKLESRQNTLVTLSYQLVKVGTRIVVGVIALAVVSKTMEWRFLAIILGVGLLLGGAFSLRQLIQSLARSKMAGRFLEGKERLDFSALRLQLTIVPAIFLFLTFSAQTSLLAYWLGDGAAFLEVMYWVVITYSLTSFLPPMSFFDPLVKSAFGALLYTQVIQPDILLFAFTITWVINRGIPALLSGLFFRRLSGIAQATSKSTM